MRLPEFIIGGAPRSGTTWLWHALDRHPRLCMAVPVRPEPRFFLRDDLFRRGLAYYSRTWFESLAPDCLLGEKSTNYLESAVAAQRIAECLPRVKLLFILRDPVTRAYSNYLWSQSNGMETMSFMDALLAEPQREAELDEGLRYSRPHALFSRGCYAQLLAPWIRRLGRDRVLCVRYEDLIRDPGCVLGRIHAFLQVVPRPRDGDGLGRINAVPGASSPPMPKQARHWLQERYRAENEALRTLLGSDFQLWQYAHGS